MRRHDIPSATFALALLALAAAPALATAAPRWDQRRIVLADTTTAEMDGMVAAAAAEWNRAGFGPRLVYRRGPFQDGCPHKRRVKADTVRVCTGGSGGWAATSKDQGQIQRSLIPIAISDVTRPYLYPTVLHELGHALGLPHIPDPHTVMDPASMEARHLTGADIALLRERYRHHPRARRT